MVDNKNELTILKNVETPCFVIDLNKVKHNCQQMRSRISKNGKPLVNLRPHQKTHKTIELADIMCNGNRNNGIVVSTLKEAEFFADSNFDNIIYGYPITQHRIQRCQALANRLKSFHLLVDNEEMLDLLDSQPSNQDGKTKWSLFLSINTGYRREGIPWDSERVLLASNKILKSNHLSLTGVYSHCGNSYSSGSVAGIQQDGFNAFHRLVNVKQLLLENGHSKLIASAGSTPSCSLLADNDLFLVDEIHPGNYVFYDWMQMEMGSCGEEDIACCVMTRIIGFYPHDNLILIDCGFTGLSHDSGNCLTTKGYARILNHPELKLEAMTQEIGKLTSSENGKKVDFNLYHVGEYLFLLPWHSCATAAMHTKYVLIHGEGEGSQSFHENAQVKTLLSCCREW